MSASAGCGGDASGRLEGTGGVETGVKAGDGSATEGSVGVGSKNTGETGAGVGGARGVASCSDSVSGLRAYWQFSPVSE